MSRGIFLIGENDGLVELKEQPYDTEELLQKLLATHPALLAGDQIDRAFPRKWLLISREMDLASQEDGSARWSVDHLFVDQDAIPTVIEVKRSSDTRIRREVVLEYAANAVVYWPVETLRARYEVTCTRESIDASERLAAFLGADGDAENFWGRVKTNLQAGKIRLVFVGDEIPSELRRIVEFLNQQMDPAEVLAVEIKQYVSGKIRTLVPSVIGQTEEAQQRKSVGVPGKQWDEASFFSKITAEHPEEAQIAHKLLDWITPRVTRIWWGKGAKDASIVPVLEVDGVSRYFVGIWTYGKIDIQFQSLAKVSSFQSESARLDLLNRLNQISGVHISPGSITKYPSIPLSVFVAPKNLDQLLSILQWVIQEIKPGVK